MQRSLRTSRNDRGQKTERREKPLDRDIVTSAAIVNDHPIADCECLRLETCTLDEILIKLYDMAPYLRAQWYDRNYGCYQHEISVREEEHRRAGPFVLEQESVFVIQGNDVFVGSKC